MTVYSSPTIILPHAIYARVMHWIDRAEGEVSGVGTVVYDRTTNSYTVDEVFLLKQECSSAETELDAQAIAEVESRLDTDDGLRWWWHSHASMGVFWSGTDHTALRQLSEPGWFLATVFNKRRESLSCYVQGQPSKVYIPDITLQINEPRYSDELVASWSAEFDEKVTEKSYQTVKYTRYWDYNQTPAPTLPPSTLDVAEGLKLVSERQAALTKYNDLRTDDPRFTQLEADAWLYLEQLEDALEPYVEAGLIEYSEAFGWGD